MTRNHPRPLGPRSFTSLLFLAIACAVAVPARGQSVRSWSPPSDSLVRIAGSAKARFKAQAGDSLGGANFDGYQIVGDMGRHLLAALGRAHWAQAQAVEATLDSMGLDVEMACDPKMRAVVFMLVRNPYKRSSDAVGFLYWWRNRELLIQGAAYPPAQDVSLRAWWTGRGEYPYEAITLFRRRTGAGETAMRLFRLSPDGTNWALAQYEGAGPEFGPGAEAVFADVNRDGQPEVVSWRAVAPDSFLHVATDAPALSEELTYTERPEGFVLHDARMLPGPTETVNMFASLLVHGQADLARRLLLHPEALDSMLVRGWGRHKGAGAWNIEYGEEAQPWPEWCELKVREDAGWKHWIFHFTIKDDRWVIRDWLPVQPPDPALVRAGGSSGAAMPGAPADSAGAPAAPPPGVPARGKTK